MPVMTIHGRRFEFLFFYGDSSRLVREKDTDKIESGTTLFHPIFDFLPFEYYFLMYAAPIES